MVGLVRDSNRPRSHNPGSQPRIRSRHTVVMRVGRVCASPCGTATGTPRASWQRPCLVVLELVDLVFGDAVSLGGFVPVTLLVVTLLLSRTGVRRLLSDTQPDD